MQMTEAKRPADILYPTPSPIPQAPNFPAL